MCFVLLSLSHPRSTFQIASRSQSRSIAVQVAHVLFTVSSLTVNGAEWLRCQHRPPVRDSYDLHSLTTGRESCNMYGVRPLLAGDKLRIQNGVANLVAEVTMNHCSNIGIVKM